MKVVLFCGGLGTRLREGAETIPKPLVTVGARPIIWYLMKYYAYYGHTDFILCLGYRGDLIKQFFLEYNACMSSDFVLERGKAKPIANGGDVDDWKITFVDTGLHSNIGGRLMAVRDYVKDEEMILANYSDQLSDVPLPDMLERFRNSKAVAGFVAVRPSQSFHCVRLGEQGLVAGVDPVETSDIWINGGYMALKREIFDYLQPGDELVEAPFRRLIEKNRLFAYRYEGFWKSMDTFKDKIGFDRMWGMRDTPWDVWSTPRSRTGSGGSRDR